MKRSNSQVVFTNQAQCRDCYRCVRVCPVKAIRLADGQAYVEESRCIACGTCIRECPQGAKSFRDDLDKARRILQSGKTVAASIAPSFAAVFADWEQTRLPAALRRLGFGFVAETAVGAYHAAIETRRFVEAHPGRSQVSSACPAVVNYIERYRPELLDRLVPVVSPMIAHAHHLRKKLAGCQVVFIGPCVAKKFEADRAEYHGMVDCALTFAELRQWLKAENIDLSECEESGFDEAPEGDARLFALEGGGVKTSGWSADLLSGEVVAASGFEEINAALDCLADGDATAFIEPLFCPQGCINGPAIGTEENLFNGKKSLLKYACENCGGKPVSVQRPELTAEFRAQTDSKKAICENDIRQVLEKTGKAAEENQLNCGACGYPSCREQAKAVLRGMAEAEMCIPYMRRLAEQRTDRIIETSPNGIVIFDERLRILHMNPAFRKMFMTSDAVCGQHVSYLMDPAPLESLASGETEQVTLTVEHEKYHLACHEILYRLPDEKQYVGIFVDITKTRASRQELDRLRAQTVKQARELIDHQIRLAETIARSLGESTAQGEDLIEKLLLIVGGEQKG
jgi:PAS domain S-box-containing protein